jgi:plasmid stabilization system protein ParE
MANFDLAPKANIDLTQISRHYRKYIDAATTRYRIAQILDEIELLAGNKFWAKRMEFPPGMRHWKVYNNLYRVYFRRLDNESIKVYRIVSTRAKPLEPHEIV